MSGEVNGEGGWGGGGDGQFFFSPNVSLYIRDTSLFQDYHRLQILSALPLDPLLKNYDVYVRFTALTLLNKILLGDLRTSFLYCY